MDNKNKYQFFVILLLILIIAFISISANDLKSKSENTIKNIFGKSVEYKLVKWRIPPKLKLSIENEVKQKFHQDFLYSWKITKKGDLVGIAIIDNVIGKSMPITFLVIFDMEGKILKSEIIKYREPYGGGVAAESWNEQFIGKDENSGYKVGEDIQAISGATISVHSVSKGIKKLSLIFEEMIKSDEYNAL